ncbi:MAG: FUSC family protein [Chloroflexi bacterium]|nr:FUSC family protein [Chloroflexota bacterium]
MGQQLVHPSLLAMVAGTMVRFCSGRSTVDIPGHGPIPLYHYHSGVGRLGCLAAIEATKTVLLGGLRGDGWRRSGIGKAHWREGRSSMAATPGSGASTDRVHSGAPAQSDPIMSRLPNDPGLSSLRRAVRAAIVIPAAFAFAKLVIGDLQVTTFVAFGCFALLVMADFGGPRRARAAAYVMSGLAGAALVTLGTLSSPVAWVGALLMLLVGFGIQLAGVFGSYVAAAQTALLLSFVLAVSVPAPAGAVGPRLLGWLSAAAVSTLSGVFIWPRFERLHLRSKAAEACRALARFIASQHHRQHGGELTHDQEAAWAAVEAVRGQYAATPKRPAGPARRDRAFVELLTELERALDFTSHPFRLQRAPVHPCIAEGDQLASAVVRTLEASADVLTGGAPPDLQVLDRARLAHRQALDGWAADALRTGTPPDEVLAGLDADHKLRVVSYLALAVGTNATIAAGGQVGDGVSLPAGTPRVGRMRPLIRIVRTIRTHLSPTSGVLHQSLRVGVGLALAVLLARLLRLDHAFWVVLGTLSVLRSNAFGTGRTTLEALAGTVIGFTAGALFTLLVGATSLVLWIALPAAVFLATYAASAISFIVGQAAFTLLVIILFNLISPVGWRVGLVRVEDIAAGVVVSVAVGLLLWPRGARGELVAAVGGLYRSVAAYLAGAFDCVLERGSLEDVSVGRRAAVRARDRVGEAFDQFLHERGTKPLDPEMAAMLVAAGAHAIIVGDLLALIAQMGYRVHDPSDATRALRVQTQLMLASFLRLADRLDGTPSALLSGARVSDEALREVALSCLRTWGGNPDGGRSALAAVIAGEWLQQLGDLTAGLEFPVARAVEAVHLPWWR